jgi:hypothetical protein
MKRSITTALVLLVMAFFCGLAQAKKHADSTAPEPTPTLTFEEQKQALELEKLQLENEKLKFEMEKMKAQSTQTAQPVENRTSKEDKEMAVEQFMTEKAKKSEEMAKENKDKETIVVLDFVNAEIWYKGVRYSLHELNYLAEDNHLDMSKLVDQIAPSGDPRNLYRVRNLSLLRYSMKNRGIMGFAVPVKDDDFQFLTPEGITFSSGIGDVRNVYQSLYYTFDGESHEKKLRVLKYIHNVAWDFADRLQFYFDKDDKLVKVRFGVLDEH